ncbi:hypothetical protein C8F04DRAFT_1074631 [Mycena alexandri]|uniref:Uncharacterized protein n=1 Tax=Mycena alexandri TaxID=1745969 RepID=A0AAD6X116_9AGAR|nr:hypothetical protein C8F04DRAFT_1106761 [Mycena alexandri]KAJ7042732.1 hypothetical protein C8F04DRAFT_1074631 [Mycena alexandri]
MFHAYIRTWAFQILFQTAMSNTKLHVPNALDAHLEDVVLAFGIAGVVLPALLLLAIAYAAWNPVSRHHLNRVSFRFLVCALISNLIFAATSIPTFSGPSAGCSFMAFFGLSILMFTACMFFCIALNLQLVLVHHVNGNLMEKFYYIGSVAVVAILNITPYAAGQFGYYNGTCWFSSPDPDVQFRWLLGSQSVWMLLMSTGEVLCFLVILGYMYRIHSPAIGKPPIVAYRSFILRIGLYPLLSCCLNFSGSILDIWLSKNPVPTELQWRLSFVDLCVFGLRPILYTFLAAADPGFLCAIRALLNNSKTTPSISSTSGLTFTNFSAQKNGSTTAVSHSGIAEAKGKALLAEQEPEQSGLSEAEREDKELQVSVDAQTRSEAEDIMRQI